MSHRITINRLKLHRRGFTLVELIIAFAILVVVLSVIFSFFFFGNTTFRRSVSKAQAQAELRQAGDFITNQLRNAGVVTFTDPGDSSYNRIYLDIISGAESGKIVYIPKDGGAPQDKTDQVIKPVIGR